MLAIMRHSLGRAGQPGWVVVAGQRVRIIPANNLPDGGFFIENMETGETIRSDGSEFDYEF